MLLGAALLALGGWKGLKRGDSGQHRPSNAALTEPSEAFQGEILRGRVVGVADGDTVTVLDMKQRSHKIRLLGIDAPEKNQPFGKVAKQALSDRVFDREVEVRVNARDRYGRLVGQLRVEGRDVNLIQVQEGLAWHYAEYAASQFPGEAGVYAATEREARAEHRGLWGYPDPLPPWVWRRKSREKK